MHPLLTKLTRRWRYLNLVAIVLAAAGAALFLAAVLIAATEMSQRILTVTTFVAFSILVLAMRRFNRNRDGELEIAYHLNRLFPEVQESTQLLLEPPLLLSPLESLQLHRTADRLSELDLRHVLPLRMVRFGVLVGVGGGLCFLLTLLWPMQGEHHGIAEPLLEANHEDPRRSSSSSDQGPRIERVKVTVRPPQYTGLATRHQSSLSIRSEENSEIDWEIEFSDPVSEAMLVFNSSDTVWPGSNSEKVYKLARKVSQSLIYFAGIKSEGQFEQISDYHQIEVIPDEAPSLVVIEPEHRTVLDPLRPGMIPVKVLAEDDYRVTNASIVATVTHGSGESIKVREAILQFERTNRVDERRVELTSDLKPGNLELVPGDELYFFVEVQDNREPQRNRSRSETFFVVMPDTSVTPLVVSAGLAINPLPEYFRSQRQIIIDTEKLIAEADGLDKEEFKRRSHNLGVDQKALRLRFGQFLGEEFETGIPSQLFPEDIPEPDPTQPEEHDHEQEAADDFLSGSEIIDPLDLIPEDLRHQHDFAENATLFSQSTREQLRAALSEMWDAELHLKTHEPKTALPFEYRALVLLKSVQQDSRVYVKRIGFEPTPLKPVENRLTGDLGDIEDQRSVHQFTDQPVYPNIRASLRILRDLRSNPGLSASERETLEAAGRELAVVLLKQPGKQLGVLNDLRQLLDESEHAQTLCQSCLRNIERVFRKILPSQLPEPTRESRSINGLANRYLDRLGKAP